MKLVKKIIPALQVEIASWTEAVVCHIPGRLGLLLRRFHFSRALLESRSVYIGVGTTLVALENITVEPYVHFGLNNHLNAIGGKIIIHNNTAFNNNVLLNASVGGTIEIGSDCLIGPSVIFRTASHKYRNKEILIKCQGHKVGNIVLEEDVWIGAGAILLGGITVGRGSVIGAGAVVTKDIPPFSIAVGVPATVIGSRTVIR